MKRVLTLSEYVKKRTGVPLGASGSLSNMLKRSLGAESFYLFWQYWNPIWSFYLSRNVMRPLNEILPPTLSLVVTFVVSGALHDLVVSLLKLRPIFFVTPWFLLMGLMVVTTRYFDVSYRNDGWLFRALYNGAIILICLLVTIALKENFF